MEFFLMLISTIFFPPILLFGFFVVNPREEVVVIRFGKYIKTLNTEGIRWIHPIGRELRRIPTQDITLHVSTSTVVEQNGTPILISAVAVYRVEDTRKAALDVEDYKRFINDQAGAVVKRVSSLFPYESPDHDAPCLKTESDKVTQAYIHELQKAVAPAGIKVLSFRLNDLTYAPEIAQAMLMRQQALALIDARKVIVEGAVSIVKDALDRLKDNGIQVSPQQQETLVSNLLVVLCSGEKAQPVLQVQSHKPS
jgi:regulator of protease activity HflC (stomatin/prohibitin superfamily)